MALSIDHDRVVEDNPEFHNLTVLWRRSIEETNFSYEGCALYFKPKLIV